MSPAILTSSSTKGRQTKHVFVRAVLVRENGSLLATRAASWNPLSFHGKYRYTKTRDDDTRDRIEIELVNKNPFPQRYLHSPPLPLSLDSFQSRTTLSKGISSTSLRENLDRRKRSQLNLDVNNYPGDIFHRKESYNYRPLFNLLPAAYTLL